MILGGHQGSREPGGDGGPGVGGVMQAIHRLGAGRASPTDGVTSSSPPSERSPIRTSPRITTAVRASHR